MYIFEREIDAVVYMSCTESLLQGIQIKAKVNSINRQCCKYVITRKSSMTFLLCDHGMVIDLCK